MSISPGDRLLILGIAGFTGRAMERMVASMPEAREISVIGADLGFDAAERTGKVDYHTVDATDRGALHALLDELRPTHICNLVGTFGNDDFARLLAINVAIPESILAWAAGSDSVQRVLLIGSAAEYGVPEKNPITEDHPLRPVNLYGLSKVYQTRLAELYHRTRGVPVVVARTFNIYGPGAPRSLAVGNWQAQIDAAKDGDTIRVGNLETYRDYLHVDEVARDYWTLLERGEGGEVYNVCSGEATKMATVLESMLQATGKHVDVDQDQNLRKANDVPVVFGSRVKIAETSAHRGTK